MTALGLPAELAAHVAGVSGQTLRRWRDRARHSRRLRYKRGPSAALSVDLEAQVEGKIRGLKGLIGAEAIHRDMRCVSRRQAASVKQRVVRQMERERLARQTRVSVSEPGVLRGFDAIHLRRSRSKLSVLISSDGCIPFRTSGLAVSTYDEDAVARALERDIDANGAPLVLRLDRAQAHRTTRIEAILESHGILLLHGPPRHPCYYGQLERQNRDHRVWLDDVQPSTIQSLQATSDEMIEALNTKWPRATLGWQTPAEIWNKRAPLRVERAELAEQVVEQLARIRRRLDQEGRRLPQHLPERLAIEQTLTARGLLCQQPGGWC